MVSFPRRAGKRRFWTRRFKRSYQSRQGAVLGVNLCMRAWEKGPQYAGNSGKTVWDDAGKIGIIR